jgi:fido (protein-threonine AMPylation protein)
LKYLSDIHRHLFKDIFDFAGEKRVCGLSTENLCFTDPRKIQTE